MSKADSISSKLTFAYWEACPEASVRRLFWAFAISLAAFRLLVLLVVPLDLSGDEAYYWEWGRNLDWGYFSKPPGIAWLMALVTKLGGNSTFGVRFFSVLLGTGSLICLFKLAWRIYGPAVAMITAIAFVANPANAALNLILTIDAPLVFFWSLALLAFWEFIQPNASGFKWGSLLFLALVGGMLSKQMMLVFHPVAILFLALSKNYRYQLGRPALWLCLLGSMIAWLPPLWWNFQNDWLTLRHTMHHFESGSISVGRHIGRFFEFIGSQLGIITPILFVLLMAVVVGVLWRWQRLADRERFLWLFGGPALLVMLCMGLRQRLNPNWPAVFYGSTIILLVGWAANKWSLDAKLDRWRKAFRPGLKIGIIFAVAVYIALAALSFGLVHIPGTDPTARIRGWSQLAGEVDAIRSELPNGNSMLMITQGHRFMTSALAFYLAGQPRVYIYNPRPEEIRSQYDLWESPAAHIGKDALLVVRGAPEDIAPELTNCFERLEIQNVFRHPDQGKDLKIVTVAVGRNLKSWPGQRE